MKILVLLVCHGTGRVSPAIPELKSIHAALRDPHIREYLVIDNALVPDYCQRLDGNTTLVGGDNALREFSGWNRGLAHVGSRLAEYDLIHAVTETFNFDYRHYLGLLTPKVLSLAVEKRFCVGHVDAYPREVTLFGERSRAWIRTCFVLLPVRAVQALKGFVTTDQYEKIFTDDPRQPFRPDAPIDATYQQFIWQWLTDEGGGAAEIGCHRDPFPLSPETFARFRAKAISIINEHGFSARLRKCGYPTLDLEWVYDMLLQRNADEIDWNPPIDAMLAQVVYWRERLGITAP